MPSIRVPFLTDEKIAEIAKKFLAAHKVSSMPVHIEKILECGYNINIIPTPGIRQATGIVDAFMSSDFSAIYVDEFIQERRYNRYRFTLAHEIGHFVMHKDILSQFEIDSRETWKASVNELGTLAHTSLEYQADNFAGLVLAPPVELKKEFDKRMRDIVELIKKARDKGIKQNQYVSYAVDYAARLIAPVFEVSEEVIRIRIDKDGLNEKIL